MEKGKGLLWRRRAGFRCRRQKNTGGLLEDEEGSPWRASLQVKKIGSIYRGDYHGKGGLVTGKEDRRIQ